MYERNCLYYLLNENKQMVNINASVSTSMPVINTISPQSKPLKDGGVIKIIVNKLLDLIMIEINNAEMKDNIQKKIIHPLLYMIYSQLYPYIYTFIIIIILMFLILISLLICFIIYLKK